MRTLFIALRAALYMTGFVLLWGWIALSVRSFDQRIGIVLPGWTEILGVMFILIGGMLALACGGIFIGRGRGTPAPFDPPKEFVAQGPYKYVRNPMYIGGLTVLIGFGLYLHSISILLLSLLVFVLVHLFVLFAEEPGLEQRFGKSYLEYKKSANRWIPKWK